jgi:LPXTG-motif cell wall-anchored protein
MAKKLPKTASDWPLVGLLGVLFFATGMLLTVRRRFQRTS